MINPCGKLFTQIKVFKNIGFCGYEKNNSTVFPHAIHNLSTQCGKLVDNFLLKNVLFP